MKKTIAEGEDKRVQRSKKVVLAETYKLLSESGIGGVSIDEIARRTKVSKTTIYRHWPSRSALLLEACSKIGVVPEFPDTGSLKGDLTILANHLAQQLKSERWPAVLPSIIDAAERDSELATMHEKLHSGLMTPYLQAVERAKKRGEIPIGRKSSELVAEFVGPFFYRRWFSKEPIDHQFIKNIVRGIVEIAKLK